MPSLALAAVEKRIAALEKRTRHLGQPRTQLVTAPFAWAAFLAADADDRDRMRNAYAAAVEAIHAAAPASDDPLRITQILIAASIPTDENLDRYRDDPDPAPARAPDPYERFIDRQAQAEDDDDVADPDPEPFGDPDAILYVDDLTGYPISRREHQARRQQTRERRAIERRRVTATSSYRAWENRQ